MKNTSFISLKIVLLALALIVVVSTIFVFAKQRLSEMPQLSNENQFQPELQNPINNIDTASLGTKPILLYDFVDQINFYLQDSLIDTAIYNKGLSNYIYAFTPQYTNECITAFNTTWNNAFGNSVSKTITYLDGICLSDSSLVIGTNEEVNEKVQEVRDILRVFKNAQMIAQNQRFTNEQDVRNRISNAENYASNQYISKNVGLHNQLLSLRRNIGRNHFAQLRNRARQINDYNVYDLSNAFYNQYEYFRNLNSQLYGGAVSQGELQMVYDDVFEHF